MKRWGQRLLESQETEKASSRSQLLHQRFEKSLEHPSVSALPRSGQATRDGAFGCRFVDRAVLIGRAYAHHAANARSLPSAPNSSRTNPVPRVLGSRT